MKRLALGFGLLTLLVLKFAYAATENSATPDELAIRATVTDYIESYYDGDAARMERSLHPHYLKHTIRESNGELTMTEKTGLQMVQDVRQNGPSTMPPSDRKVQITVLDVADDVASAKLVTARWVDYMTLSKWNGQWKIVSVVLRQQR